MLPPQVYEDARAGAPDVIVVDISRFSPPPSEAGYGVCWVLGRVVAVERGQRYRVGEAVSFPIPCARPRADIPMGGAIWQDWDMLLASRRGRAFLTAQGTLALDQYDMLAP